MNYTKFSDEDLFESYQTTLDYGGKLENDLLLEIENRGGLDELNGSLLIKEKFSSEAKKIYKTVNHLRRGGMSLEIIQTEITSDEIPKEDLIKLISKYFNQTKAHDIDVSIDFATIMQIILGVAISSVTCAAIWFYSMLYSGHMFFILIPGFVIISYGIIRLLTGKSKKNIAVYIGTVLAVFIALIVGTSMRR